MKLRILTAIVGIPLVVVVLAFSHTPVLPFVAALLAGVGVFEMHGCIGVRNKISITIPSIILASAAALSIREAIKHMEFKSYFFAIFASVAFVYMFYLMVLSVVSKGTKSISDMAMTVITTLYITVGFVSIVLLRDFTVGETDVGAALFALVFVGAWVPDGAGYFVGRAFGKHKLIPDVSPKKTVEGAVGGVVFGAIAFVVFGLIVEAMGLCKANYIQLALAGLVVSVVSIFGDLIASLIKRQYGIKDYGKIFPGHGGVMDRFDSILAVAPFILMISSHPEIFALFE